MPNRARLLTLIAAALIVPSLLGAAAPAMAGEFSDQLYYFQSKRDVVKRVRELEGKPAPALSVTDWRGEPVSLDDLRGKTVLLEFWRTTCHTCVRHLPGTQQLADRHEDDGLVVVGVHHSTSGVDRLDQMRERLGAEFPMAVDVEQQSEQAYKVGFWPTFVFIDARGIVRAAGLSHTSIDRVARTLIEEQRTGKREPGDVPSSWLEKRRDGRRSLAALEAMPTAPPIASTTWLNSPPLSLSSLRGNVVLLDFWATWCGPCLASVPKLNQLQRTYGESGLRVIGVCNPRGAEKMRQIAQERGIEYPICALPDDSVLRKYAVDSFPDYYLIDRTGRVRVADTDSRKLVEAIETLLAESRPGAGSGDES